MDINKIKNALQDLIIRLQDAEKGYKEIALASSNMQLKNWLNKYATERHQMHRHLEKHMKDLGGKPEVKTSFLGDLHRLFIDIKINNVDDQYDAILNEIKRGSDVLLKDYSNVISNVQLPTDILTTLQSQKATIEMEVGLLEELKHSSLSALV